MPESSLDNIVNNITAYQVDPVNPDKSEHSEEGVVGDHLRRIFMYLVAEFLSGGELYEQDMMGLIPGGEDKVEFYREKFQKDIRLLNYLKELNPFPEDSESYDRYNDMFIEVMNILGGFLTEDEYDKARAKLPDTEYDEFNNQVFGEKFTRKFLGEGAENHEKETNRKRNRIRAMWRALQGQIFSNSLSTDTTEVENLTWKLEEAVTGFLHKELGAVYLEIYGDIINKSFDRLARNIENEEGNIILNDIKSRTANLWDMYVSLSNENIGKTEAALTFVKEVTDIFVNSVFFDIDIFTPNRIQNGQSIALNCATGAQLLGRILEIVTNGQIKVDDMILVHDTDGRDHSLIIKIGEKFFIIDATPSYISSDNPYERVSIIPPEHSGLLEQVLANKSFQNIPTAIVAVIKKPLAHGDAAGNFIPRSLTFNSMFQEGILYPLIKLSSMDELRNICSNGLVVFISELLVHFMPNDYSRWLALANSYYTGGRRIEALTACNRALAVLCPKRVWRDGIAKANIENLINDLKSKDN